ncbi:MAG: TonB-dependent receptor [Acidobacteriota bacterium]|nr:TonB-dependent receptor [Acidobacteriota bacterium]
MQKPTHILLLLPLLLSIAGAAPAQNSENKTSQEAAEQANARKHRIDDVIVVVTAARTETPTREVANSISVITSREMEELQKTTVLDVLRTVPSLDIVQAGGAGKTSSVFMRGAKSEHTLVLMDGVEMNDPISAGRSFDLANLTTDNIERIEILRGPQSTLYGSDAIGGVINIITKTGKGKPSGFVAFEGGAFESLKESAGISGGGERINYSFGFSRMDTAGISVANSRDGNSERDGYGNTTFSGKFGITPAQGFDIDILYRRVDSSADLDNEGGAGGEDVNYTLSSKQNFLRAQTRLSLFQGRWNQKIGFSLSDHDGRYRNDADAAHPFDVMRNTYDGRMYKFDWQNNFQISGTNALTFGLETEEEEGASYYYSDSAWGEYESVFPDKTARTTGIYLQDQVRLGGRWFTTFGVRLDTHSQFGTKDTYHIASAYVFESTGTKLKMTYGTGFKTPSLYQLYSTYGNEGLRPERSTGWDAGIEQSFANGKLSMSAGYFDNRFDEMVDFNSATFRYANIANAISRGLEIGLSAQTSDRLTVRGSYTYTDTEDKATGLDLLRRARHKIGLDADYRFLARGSVNVNIIHAGRRYDTDYSVYPYARVELSRYVLVNLGAMYDLTRHLRLFGRVDNLLNSDYEEVKGYGTPGVSAFGGMKVLF